LLNYYIFYLASFADHNFLKIDPLQTFFFRHDFFVEIFLSENLGVSLKNRVFFSEFFCWEKNKNIILRLNQQNFFQKKIYFFRVGGGGEGGLVQFWDHEHHLYYLK